MSDSATTILLVDDDADIREAVRDTLELEGYTVHEAVDGEDAFTYLHRNPLPGLILLDWNMAPMNAPDFMRRFQSEPALSRIPVVLLTADMRADEKMNTSGFADLLKKPVDLETLFAIVARYCDPV
jgi:CheY-like chemotaxis protein